MSMQGDHANLLTFFSSSPKLMLCPWGWLLVPANSWPYWLYSILELKFIPRLNLGVCLHSSLYPWTLEHQRNFECLFGVITIWLHIKCCKLDFMLCCVTKKLFISVTKTPWINKVLTQRNNCVLFRCNCIALARCSSKWNAARSWFGWLVFCTIPHLTILPVFAS